MPAIRTLGGHMVDPFKPKPEDVRPWAMLHSISQLNRFTGHVKHPYSVGQHEFVLYHFVPKHLRKAALVHDLSESWFNDIASPVKAHRSLRGYKREEHKAKVFIATQLGVPEADLEALDPYDKAIYIDERDNLHDSVEVLGYGDYGTGLGIDAHWFIERSWSDIKAVLYTLFAREFGERVLYRGKE